MGANRTAKRAAVGQCEVERRYNLPPNRRWDWWRREAALRPGGCQLANQSPAGNEHPARAPKE